MKKLIITMFVLLWMVTGFVCADEQTEQWVYGWQQTEALNSARAGSAVLAVDGYIYAIGGVDGRQFLRSVEYARVLDNGELGPWRYTRSLNQERGFLDAVAYQGYLYVVAGGSGPHGKNLLRSIERAKIMADGALSEWQVLPGRLLMPRRCVKLAIDGNKIYALGGFGGALLDTVESARILSNGDLGAWQLEDKTMLMPRYVNAVKKQGDRLYVIGGHREDEGVGIAEIEYAVFDSNNNLDAGWQSGESLKVARYALSAAVNDKHLYAMGGLDGAIYQDVIEVIDANNAKRGWQRGATTLSSPRANFGAVTVNNILYVIGGTNRDGYFQSVEYAGFDEKGDIGFMASPQQVNQYEQDKLRKTVTDIKSLLPNHGVVVEVIQTRAYSYLKIKTSAGMTWLAAPHDEYKQGMNIRYSRGLTMINFFSKKLQRQFEVILFVEKVAIE